MSNFVYYNINRMSFNSQLVHPVQPTYGPDRSRNTMWADTDGRLYQNIPDYRKTNNFSYKDKKNIFKIWKFYLPKQKNMTSDIGK